MMTLPDPPALAPTDIDAGCVAPASANSTLPGEQLHRILGSVVVKSYPFGDGKPDAHRIHAASLGASGLFAAPGPWASERESVQTIRCPQLDLRLRITVRGAQ